MSLLTVEDLSVRFYSEGGVVHAVNDLSFEINRGETLGVVGESGAGKSVTGLSILRLIDDPGQIESGRILFNGENILEMSREELNRLRGNDISMVFQNTGTTLNPVYTIGEQIAETKRHHLGLSKTEAKAETIELLDTVGIPDAASRYSDYPHQFSGGMQQRVVIAIALSCDPELVICDEPTTALDVTIEAQILDLLQELADESDMAIQLITHDLGVIAQISDRVMVMYGGEAVETAPAEKLFYDPKHPYTVGLLSSIPRIGTEQETLNTIPGSMPELTQRISGCAFHPRCPYREDVCKTNKPELIDVADGADTDENTGLNHTARCFEYSGELVDGLDYEVVVED